MVQVRRVVKKLRQGVVMADSLRCFSAEVEGRLYVVHFSREEA